jgi:hypothetical protein
MAALPYVTAPGNIERALNGIKTAATPPTVSQDFVKEILLVKGGSGNQMTAYLKKIGFANADGSPSPIYKRFRNSATTGAAAAEALKVGYAPLYARNEYMHSLSDEKLRGLIIEETGSADDASLVGCIMGCIKGIKKFATFNAASDVQVIEDIAQKPSEKDGGSRHSFSGEGAAHAEGVGLNLAYTINLNLPATSDIAVFNAIFKSLKENLLKASGG